MKKYIKYASLLLTFLLIISSGISICANSSCSSLSSSPINSWGARLDGKLDRIYRAEYSLCHFDMQGTEYDEAGKVYIVHDSGYLYVFVNLDCKRANVSEEQHEKTVTVAIDWENKGESAKYYTVSYPNEVISDPDFEYAVFEGNGVFNVEYKIPLQCREDADIGFDAEVKYTNSDGESIMSSVRDSNFDYEHDISDPEYFDYINLMIPVQSLEYSYFLDVTGDWFDGKAGYPWYYNSVKYCFRNSLMVGVDNDHFSPNAEMSRAMLVQVLYNMEGNPDISSYKNKFADVKDDDWFYDAVVWAADKGIVAGTSDSAFSPNEPVTREQLSAIAYRYANSKKYDMTASADIGKFNDSANVSAYAKDALEWSVGVGLISGNRINGETLLDPRGNATRAQVAMILENFCEKVAK